MKKVESVKIQRILSIRKDDMLVVNNLLSEGWLIANMSAWGTEGFNYGCYIVLEKTIFEEIEEEEVKEETDKPTKGKK